MKKTLLTISAIIFTGSIAFAGPMGYSSKGKQIIVDTPIEMIEGCENCWTGTSFDVYAGYTFMDEEVKDVYEDGFTAGIGINQFFSKYLGLGLEAMWIENPSIIHQVGANIIGRLPIDLGKLCVSPYVFGGVGGHFDSTNQVTFAAGGGLEVLFARKCAGVFADGRYVFADETSDYVTARAGLRFRF